MNNVLQLVWGRKSRCVCILRPMPFFSCTKSVLREDASSPVPSLANILLGYRWSRLWISTAKRHPKATRYQRIAGEAEHARRRQTEFVLMSLLYRIRIHSVGLSYLQRACAALDERCIGSILAGCCQLNGAVCENILVAVSASIEWQSRNLSKTPYACWQRHYKQTT